ncbi:MAG: DUF2442 domain-containing protein [Pyrinomonadaceae bacterium]
MDKQLEELGLTEEEFERQFQEATRRGAEHLARLPKAASARFDTKSKRIVLEMQNGTTVLVPVNLIQGLQEGDDRTLSDFTLMTENSQIHWNELDVQFYIKDLLRGVFGTPRWMAGLKEHLSEIGKRGGASRSPAKRSASRNNGKLGGRPRKQQTV